MIVLDASVPANALADDTDDGDRARAALAGQDVAAPDLADVETAAVLRRRRLANTLAARRFAQAIDDLTALAMQRYPVLPLLRRGYELRANVTSYDATYIVLAEQLNSPLLTADTKRAAAPGIRCPIILIQ